VAFFLIFFGAALSVSTLRAENLREARLQQKNKIQSGQFIGGGRV
jgi:hypothetical protein